MKTLKISDSLSLPPDTVTSTLVVYGGKGMGKSVFGSVLGEELAAARLRWSFLDPLGVNWGIRHAADGVGPGVECLILGGVHGDIPIYPDGGAAVADVVVEESCNVLVDFSRSKNGEAWGVGEKIRFATAYARRLFQRQGSLIDGRKREPLMQILDEGARFIPQIIPAGNPDLAMCVSAWQQFAEEGRNVGLGLCVLTQRSARMNKDIAELADAMIAFRTIGPNSLGAVLDWLGEHVERSRIKDLSEQVRKLPRGSALVVSPGWLEIEKVVPMRMRRTFDSSATPKPGERVRTAKGEGAKPDLEKIQARMVETIERAKADDPKELRKRIAELEKELRAKPKAEPVETIRQVPIPIDWNSLSNQMHAAGDVVFAEFWSRVDTLIRRFEGDSKTLRLTPFVETPRRAAPPPMKVTGGIVHVDREQQSGRHFHRDPNPGNGAGSELGNSGARRMMTVLCQAGNEGVTPSQLAIRTGIAKRGGTFRTYLGKIITNRWAARDAAGRIVRTSLGETILGDFDPLPSGAELLSFWLRELGESGAARILETIADAYPNGLTREEVGERTGIAVGGGTFRTYVGKLKTLELLVGGRGELRLSEELVG